MDTRKEETEPTPRKGIHYSTNQRPAVCCDCGKLLDPGKARIWPRGKGPWGSACRDKAMCHAMQVLNAAMHAEENAKAPVFAQDFTITQGDDPWQAILAMPGLV